MEIFNPPSPRDDAPSYADGPADGTKSAQLKPENMAPSGSAYPAQEAD